MEIIVAIGFVVFVGSILEGFAILFEGRIWSTLFWLSALAGFLIYGGK